MESFPCMATNINTILWNNVCYMMVWNDDYNLKKNGLHNMEVMCGIKGNRFEAIWCFINGILVERNWFFFRMWFWFISLVDHLLTAQMNRKCSWSLLFFLENVIIVYFVTCKMISTWIYWCISVNVFLKWKYNGGSVMLLRNIMKNWFKSIPESVLCAFR